MRYYEDCVETSFKHDMPKWALSAFHKSIKDVEDGQYIFTMHGEDRRTITVHVADGEIVKEEIYRKDESLATIFLLEQGFWKSCKSYDKNGVLINNGKSIQARKVPLFPDLRKQS